MAFVSVGDPQVSPISCHVCLTNTRRLSTTSIDEFEVEGEMCHLEAVPCYECATCGKKSYSTQQAQNLRRLITYNIERIRNVKRLSR